MWMIKRKTTAALAVVPPLLAGLCLLGQPALADKPPAAQDAGRASRDELTAASFSQLHKLIAPQPNEFRWDEIPWLTSLWHARQKAAAEDKPILWFGTGGAGFNDPLGTC
jgi:hypothetical protein